MPKYNHIENIPAKVFFDILKTKDFQQLKPKPREKNLEELFLSIYDDYFIRMDDDQAKEFLRLQNVKIAYEFKIDLLRKCLAFHYYNPSTEKVRNDFLDALKEGYKIEIDRTLPFRDEVKRVLDFEIGILKNEIAIAEIAIKDMRGDAKIEDFDFYDTMVGMANNLMGNTLIKDDMTLAVFVALKKSLIKQQKSKKP